MIPGGDIKVLVATTPVDFRNYAERRIMRSAPAAASGRRPGLAGVAGLRFCERTFKRMVKSIAHGSALRQTRRPAATWVRPTAYDHLEESHSPIHPFTISRAFSHGFALFALVNSANEKCRGSAGTEEPPLFCKQQAALRHLHARPSGKLRDVTARGVSRPGLLGAASILSNSFP